MDEQTRKRKISKGGEKKCHRKLYTQPHEPVISLTSDHCITGFNTSPGMEADGPSAGLVFNRKRQGSTKNHMHDEDDVLGSDCDIFVKPKVTRRRKSSSREQTSLASSSPQIQSPLQRQKLRQSMSQLSPRRHFSGSMPGSPEQKQCPTVSMIREDVEEFQVPIVHNQKKKSIKKNENGEAQKDCSPFKVPLTKPGETELVKRAIVQIKNMNKLRCKKKHHSSQDQESSMHDEATTSKRKENGDCSHTFDDMPGKNGGQPDKDFQNLDEMHNPSQELFTDTESGNDTDTQAIVQRTVSRFLSSQDAQNDFRTPNSPVVQRSSLTAGIMDSESEVSESSDDEANETVLEKEIRSFFASKKQHSPRGHREVAPSSQMSQSPVQQGTADGISDESEVICAGQKIPSQIEHDDELEEDSHHISPDSLGDLEDGQRLSDDNSSTSSQGVTGSEIDLEQDEEGGDKCEDIVSRGENQSQTISQKCGSLTNKDVEMAATSEESNEALSSDIEIRESSNASHTPFHSFPAETAHHHPEMQEDQAPHACLTEAEVAERMFRLYCHKDTVPQILEALKTCETIDGSTLAAGSLNDGHTCIKVIRGKVFEDETERTPSEASPVLFEENSVDIDGGMETEALEQQTKQAGQDSTSGNTKADAKTKPKKKKKRKKVIPHPGDKTLRNRLKVISGPIKGDARKKNEYRWKREIREQSKCPWSEITVEPSLESDLSILRCLKAATRTAMNQQKTHQDRETDLEEDDPDLGAFVNLVSFPDVFMTKKKDRPSFRKVPPSEIQILDGS